MDEFPYMTFMVSKVRRRTHWAGRAVYALLVLAIAMVATNAILDYGQARYEQGLSDMARLKKIDMGAK